MAEPLHVMRDGTPLRRAGVVGHRGLSSRKRETLRGLEVTSPVATWAGLAALPSLTTEGLVVAGDAFATRDAELLAPMVEAPTCAKPALRRLVADLANLLH